MNTNTTTQAAPVYVGVQHDQLNLSIYRVTPLADGMERVEYLGRDTAERATAAELVEQARVMATATGARFATYRHEGAGGVLVAEATYYRNRFAAPRLAQGVHRMEVARTAEQQQLAQEQGAQRGIPTKGQRWVVAELTGYRPVQDIPLEHRACRCYTGTTTYHPGKVVEVTYYADNSAVATIELAGGRTVRETLVAPHGDACF